LAAFERRHVGAEFIIHSLWIVLDFAIGVKMPVCATISNCRAKDTFALQQQAR